MVGLGTGENMVVKEGAVPGSLFSKRGRQGTKVMDKLQHRASVGNREACVDASSGPWELTHVMPRPRPVNETRKTAADAAFFGCHLTVTSLYRG